MIGLKYNMAGNKVIINTQTGLRAFPQLHALEESGKPLRVALIGAGAMGVGIAWQIGRTPGMRLAAVTDINPLAAEEAARAYGHPFSRYAPGTRPRPGEVLLTQRPVYLSEQMDLAIDVLVEASNTINFASQACLAALKKGMHVVLMNAEVDLALGPWLTHVAAQNGCLVTSDAGDQHGVLMRMLAEIDLWGFRIAMAGNIKGFLNRYATAEQLVREAAVRHLNPVQCCAYTDGTKLAVEMALVSNATGLVPYVTGMEGPAAGHVSEVFDRFDFSRYDGQGVVDYILGAEPGGGVYVVGCCEERLQQRYLKYYKMGEGPFYLFYRPYHLCHLETTRAIAMVAVQGRPVMAPEGRVSDVYAYAKRDLRKGEAIREAIGGDQVYGLIDRCDRADAEGVPITLLEAYEGNMAQLRQDVRRDQPLRKDALRLPDSPVNRLFATQSKWLADVR